MPPPFYQTLRHSLADLTTAIITHTPDFQHAADLADALHSFIILAHRASQDRPPDRVTEYLDIVDGYLLDALSCIRPTEYHPTNKDNKPCPHCKPNPPKRKPAGNTRRRSTPTTASVSSRSTTRRSRRT